jgi:hypothetical protein
MEILAVVVVVVVVTTQAVVNVMFARMLWAKPEQQAALTRAKTPAPSEIRLVDATRPQ